MTWGIEHVFFVVYYDMFVLL